MNLTRKKMFWLCSFNIITLFLCFNACMNIITAINLLLIFQICKNNIFLTFNTGAWRVPGAGPVLFGRGMLSINPKTLRSLSSETRRDNRGSVPDILYLEHTYRYTHKSAAFKSESNLFWISWLQKNPYFDMRESFTTIALLKVTVRSTGSKMWSGDCFCSRAIFQSLPVIHRKCILMTSHGSCFCKNNRQIYNTKVLCACKCA